MPLWWALSYSIPPARWGYFASRALSRLRIGVKALNGSDQEVNIENLQQIWYAIARSGGDGGYSGSRRSWRGGMSDSIESRCKIETSSV